MSAANGATPPHSIEAEEATLGSLLLDAAGWNKVADILKQEDFYRRDHQLIFEAIDILAGGGKPCDVVTVSEQLERNGKLEDAGGLAYLSSVARDTPTAANVLAYAQIVREHARLRRLSDLGSDIQQAIADRATSLEIAQSLVPVLQDFAAVAYAQPKRRALDWSTLESLTPPEREWAIDRWLGMGHVTLLAGDGGMGKTSVAQAMGSCLALRREYLDWVSTARTVLVWACEDDHDELWRRQQAIAKWLNVPLSDFSGRLHLCSYDGDDVELAGLLDQRRLIESPMLNTLCEQIGDYKADVVFLDSVARVYGGNENDRHQVSSFIAMLNRAARPTRAAIGLLAHPAKSAGSEYSGSTAWEASVRGRLYLGRNLPDADPKELAEAPAEDDTLRYLCRRKANYSNRDWRRVHYRNGVMVPEIAPEELSIQARPRPEYARDVVQRAVQKLANMQEYGVAASNSPKYLPRLAQEYKLLEQLTAKEFAAAMRTLRSDGVLVMQVVGRYANRNQREALVLSSSPA